MQWREDELNQLVELAKTKTNYEIAVELNRSYDSIRKKLRELRGHALTQPKKPIKELVEEDQQLKRLKSAGNITSQKYKKLLADYEKLERELAAAIHLKKTPQEFTIVSRKGGGSEATAFLVASDWHVEENVELAQVNGLNEYSFAIACERANRYFYNATRLVKMFQKEKNIHQIVLALLGDFISGYIHEELVETNEFPPAEAIFKAQGVILGGIKYLLANTECNLTIVCHSGNHGRTTHQVRFATEQGNSLEGFMYHNLAHLLKDEPRVRFIVAEGYHTYLDVYGFQVRLHHGHAIRYGGGVGGIFIPVNKAIAQWNNGKRADLDVFGHFHQFKDGGNFIVNGSLIGYNAYALSIKAVFEKPQQAFFLIDKDMGKSVVAPIWVTPK